MSGPTLIRSPHGLELVPSRRKETLPEAYERAPTLVAGAEQWDIIRIMIERAGLKQDRRDEALYRQPNNIAYRRRPV